MSQNPVMKYEMGAHVGRRILNICYEHILPNRAASTMALASRAVLHHVNIYAYTTLFIIIRIPYGENSVKKNQPEYINNELSAVPSGEYFHIIRLFQTMFVLDLNNSEAESGIINSFIQAFSS